MTERGDAAIKALGQIGSILDEHDLGVRGAVLAQLLAMWLMDHPKNARASVLDLHLVGVGDSLARREKEEG